MHHHSKEIAATFFLVCPGKKHTHENFVAVSRVVHIRFLVYSQLAFRGTCSRLQNNSRYGP